ncbi:S1 family peptidase [Leucobacter chromiireducens]|uniref:S1 family peptidase n=1 Tax=Leucobacter chromiireducens TaxID=283877 RepID=UPI000F645124|nr:S1 family peptidase [Leucobacter chromiireducens]
MQQATDAPESVAGYGVTTSGQSIVLVNSEFRDAPELAELAPKLAVDEIAFIDPAVADAATDVAGGAGYLADLGGGSLGLCSIGFTAWSPTGDPALVTAGHCSNDGAISEIALSKPSGDAAYAGTNDGVDSNGTGVAGQFGFSQFGGPGNSPGAENAPDSTDIGVIDITNPALTLHPSVTDWTTAGADDLAASTIAVKNVGVPVSGTVEKSGRTTGVTSGDTTVMIEYNDGSIRPTEILDGYMQVSGRWVHGFIGGAKSDPGDSGGAVFQGGQAVGILSGGPAQVTVGDDWAWYTRLADALTYTGGYTIALDIDAPTVAAVTPGDVLQPGETITVEVPTNATELSVTQNAGTPETLPVDLNTGTVTLSAPEELGDHTLSLTALNGYSASAETELKFSVDEAIAVPTITEQRVDAAAGERSAPVAVAGTGIAGATVTVTGLAGDEVEVLVADDGTWALSEQTVEIGAHEVAASQRIDDHSSPKATAVITVAPAAPEVTSVTPDEIFSAGSAPTEIAGTGLPGSELTLVVDTSQDTDTTRAVLARGELSTDELRAAPALSTTTVTVDDDGNWVAAVDGVQDVGHYDAVAEQQFNDVTSAGTLLGYAIEDTSTVGGGSPTPGTENPDGDLPVTGGGPLLPLMIGALLLALLGGGTVLIARRRAAHNS